MLFLIARIILSTNDALFGRAGFLFPWCHFYSIFFSQETKQVLYFWIVRSITAINTCQHVLESPIRNLRHTAFRVCTLKTERQEHWNVLCYIFQWKPYPDLDRDSLELRKQQQWCDFIFLFLILQTVGRAARSYSDMFRNISDH